MMREGRGRGADTVRHRHGETLNLCKKGATANCQDARPVAWARKSIRTTFVERDLRRDREWRRR